MADKASKVAGQDRGIDLDEVGRLVAALEEDLAKAKGGASQDLESLRGEVEALRRLLASPEQPHEDVHRGLTNIRSIMENARDAVIEDAFTVADYVSRIGRMLGM